ncbi:class I SAM-dependent methyltransferase [Microbispora sp. NPDC088329]|uniref:class I SAM-dependent methyltransferase n=1 Tax=Microbispora sp. NPDC088329 TaxID=3154869 RepID=UPI0034397146
MTMAVSKRTAQAYRGARAIIWDVPTDLRSRWNHNTHYHHLALQAVAPGAKTALDVGTGDGLLAADLRELVPQVTAIDLDPAVLDRARATGADVDWVVGDVMSTPAFSSPSSMTNALAMRVRRCIRLLPPFSPTPSR